MTASRVVSAAGSRHGKSAGDLDHDMSLDNPEEADEDEFEVVPLRVEPLPQQNASPVDIDKGMRLIQSCRDGDFAAVQRQVAEGSPAGFVAKTGWTPLAAAAYSGKSDIVRYLLELGADGMYAKSTKRLQAAAIAQQQSQSQAQIAGGGDSTASLGTARGNASSDQLLEPHLTANGSNSSITTQRNGETPRVGAEAAPSLVMAAASAGGAKKLLGNGSNTPLHWACYKGHAEIVTILLHAGYSIEDVDPIGNRALHLVCSGGFREVIEILLANSAVVDQRNRYGNRPLDLATEPTCRKLIQKFQSQTNCEWCKETFNRLRRPSLCQHCHNVYCDVKPCSSITEIVTPVDHHRPGTASTSAVVRAMRYCQECATEMGKTEQDLRNILDAKLELIRSTLELIAKASTPAASAASTSRPPTQGNDSSSRPVTAMAATSEEPSAALDQAVAAGDAAALGDSVAPLSAGGDMDGVDPPLAELEPPRPTRRLLTSDEIARSLTLSQTDAEALYTSIEAAQLKAVDRELILRAKQTYRQLVAHVALQEEIKSLMVVRPIGVRSLIEPLKTALLSGRREAVSREMLMLGVQVIRSAEAECTLYGCEAMCAKIELGTKKHRRDIVRLEASISESQVVGVNDKLLASAVGLRDRLNAEVQLQACLQPFTPLATTSDAGVETVHGFRFEDGTEVPTLLQALELRNTRIQSAVDFGAGVEGVSPTLLEDGANILKQLKKDIKDETKSEEERRRLEEEAALKAAKKGKKKKA